MSTLGKLAATTSLLALIGCQSVPTIQYTPSPGSAQEEAGKPLITIRRHNSARMNRYEEIAKAHNDINTFSERTGRNPTEKLLAHLGENAHKLLRTYTYAQAIAQVTGVYNPHYDVEDDPAFVHFKKEDQRKVIAVESVKEHIGPKFSVGIEKIHAGVNYTSGWNLFQKRSNERNTYNVMTAQSITGEAYPSNVMEGINYFEKQNCDAKKGEMGILTDFNKKTGGLSAYCSTNIPYKIPTSPDKLNLCEGRIGQDFLRCASGSTGKDIETIKEIANKCYTDGRNLGYQQGFSLTLAIKQGEAGFWTAAPPDKVIPTCTLVR